MNMKSRHAFALMAAFAGTALMASAFAQAPARPGSADSAGGLPANRALNQNADVQAPGGQPSSEANRRLSEYGIRASNNADDLVRDGRSASSTASPALKRLAEVEAALAWRANELIKVLESADTDAKRDDFKAQLRETLGSQFDIRQQRHGLEIEALEAQVKKLKELVQKRQENRVEIISHRLDQIVRNSQGLGF
jgi:hypothetical protein